MSRLRFAILDSRRYRRHVLAVGKDDPRPSGLDVGQEFVRNDLKFHDSLMGSAVGRRRRQQPHIIRPLFMAHQGVDVPFRRRRSHGGVLGRHDHVEAAPGPDKLATPLQTLGGIEECAPADADLLPRLVSGKDSPARCKQARSVGGQG